MLPHPRNALPPRLDVSRANLVWLLAIGLALALAARYFLINLMLPESLNPDEGVYLMVARLLGRGYSYNSFFFDQFFLFPQILAAAFRLFGDSAETGRLTVVVFSVAGLLGLAVLARQLGAKWAALLVIVFAAVNHYYLLQSRFAMTDVPSAALMLWALVSMLAFRASGRRVWLAASAAFCVLSLLAKPLTLGLAVPLGYWMLSRRVARVNGRWTFDLRAFVGDAVVLAVVGLLTAAPFLDILNLPGEYARTVGFHWDEKDYYAPTQAMRQLALVSFVSENRMWLGLAAVGAFTASWRRPTLAVPLLVGQALSVILLLQLPPWRNHYMLLTPLVALFAAIGAQDGLAALVSVVRRRRAAASGTAGRARGRERLALPVALAFLAALALFARDVPQLERYNLAVLFEPAQNATPLARYLRKNLGSDAFLISDDPMVVYLAGALLPPSAINLPYVSTFGFSQIARAKLEESVARYRVQAIVVTGPYKQSAALMQWIQARFPVTSQAGGGASDITYGQIYMPASPGTRGGPLNLAPPAPPPNDLESDFWQRWQ